MLMPKKEEEEEVCCHTRWLYLNIFWFKSTQYSHYNMLCA